MKNSRYNWSVRRNGVHVIFNGFTGGMFELDGDHGYLEALLLEPGGEFDASLCDGATLDALESAGFVIPDGFDERYYLETLMKSARFAGEMRMTTVITRRCNFSCSYCIQSEGEKNDAVLSDEVINGIVELIDAARPAGVHTTLYGGEPLLYPGVCLAVLAAVRNADRKANAMLVTNGYLLDEPLSVSLHEAGVTAAQITLDGPARVHDTRRTTKDGRGTFERVVQNIKTAARHMKVLVRVNIDGGYEFDYEEFRRGIATDENIHVYRAPTTYEHRKSFSEGVSNLMKMEKEVCTAELYTDRLNARFPGCAATTLMSCVILPEGRLARCWNQVQDTSDTHELSLRGLISSYRVWESWNPFSEAGCRDCRMLPACGGGCPDALLKRGVPKCRFTKEGFESFIFENYRARRQPLKHGKEAKNASCQSPGHAGPRRNAR